VNVFFLKLKKKETKKDNKTKSETILRSSADTGREGAVHIVYTKKMSLENLSPIRRNNFTVSIQRLLDALPFIFSITGLKV
jgi:hypothetical protein